MSYGLQEFVNNLRAVVSASTAEAAMVGRVKPLVEQLSGSRTWVRPEYYECDAEQGFGVHVLHEEPDHGLWVVAASWLPHRGAPPHNHGTWAVVAGVDGHEKSVLWRRNGARLERERSETIGPGQVATFLSDAIHSVSNEGDATPLSLHVYGKNLIFAQRSRFDPDSGAETPFTLKLK